jgi:exonuclease III
MALLAAPKDKFKTSYLCSLPAVALLLLGLLLSNLGTEYTKLDLYRMGSQPANQYLSGSGLSISCINANSLNMSSGNKPAQLRKLYGILKLRTDIICLSDVRISNKCLVSSENDIKKILLNNPYGPYHAIFNSTKNKRGVGILIHNNVAFSAEETVRDPEENYILVRLRIHEEVFIIGAVYGPNVTNENFFRNLEHDISRLGDHPVILSGDWNTTYSSLPVDINPDCFNMAQVPNLRHSILLEQMCSNLNLVDPLRALYPDLINFSYLPRAVNKENKSRIDFFIISDRLLGTCKDCTIADSLQSSMFDHKAVLLKFLGCKKGTRTLNINNKIISDPLLDSVIDICVKETYLHYQDIDRDIKLRLLGLIGQVRMLLKDILPCHEFYRLAAPDPTTMEERNRKINRINFLRLDPVLENSSQVPINIDHDAFFEVLMNNVKNDVISYQTYIFKELSRFRKDTVVRLTELRRNFNQNVVTISELEQSLQKASEREIELSLETHPSYEYLHGEKMSPRFLSLIKKRVNSDFTSLRDSQGNIFDNEESRTEYIVSYFEKIYSEPENVPESYDNVIENFLGPDICNHPIVRDSKLLAAEKDLLDSNLTLQELDVAVEESKSRTAPGIDGYSNSFIKKFWRFFRVPLLECSLTSFRKKTLIDSFRTATIRLIPKKGDASNIKNWRPISLLNCFYKIVARAVNNRLKKFVDRITSRAQKGFTSSRYIHEVIINLSQTISYSKKHNINGAIVSIDQAKAFDSILHGYVNAAFRFFGFGDNFIDTLDTLGTGRFAQIFLDNNKISRRFKLGTGRPQGGNLSPIEFNAGEQVLIFRFELDPSVVSIFRNPEVPRNAFPVDYDTQPLDFRNESNGETDKTDGFADDTSVATIVVRGSLLSIRNILTEFEAISGLKCNYEKTNVLCFQAGNNNDDIIAEAGFTKVEELTLLGFRFNSEGVMVNESFQKVLQNIGSIITQWDRFNLSISGRIGIYKSLLLSQVSYIGSICTPSQVTLNTIQEVMDNFVCKKIKISKDRKYIPPTEGGLGLVNIKNFITGLQTVWVKRAHLSARDNWRIDTRAITSGNCLTLNRNLLPNNENQILSFIATSYTKFCDVFYKVNHNIFEAFIMNNDLIVRGHQDGRLLNVQFFSSNIPRLDMERVAKLKVKDFFSGNDFKTLDQLCEDTGINFNLLTYMRLHESLQLAVRRNVRVGSDGTKIDISKFLGVKSGEAKKVRTLLDRAATKSKIVNFTSVKTFFRLSGTGTGEEYSKYLFGAWNIGFFPNKVKDFIYRFAFNQLPLNVRVSHYIDNVSRSCTFCRIQGRGNENDETFIHLFFECQVTTKIQDWFVREYFVRDISPAEKKQLFFTGILRPDDKPNLYLTALAFTVQYLIWDARNQKRALQGLTLNNDFQFYIQGYFRNSRKIAVDFDLLRGVAVRAPALG